MPLGSQVTYWDENKEQQHNVQRLQAPPNRNLPRDRAHIPGRTSQSTPQVQNGRGPQTNRTKGQTYSSPAVLVQHGLPVTMVTATASVTVVVHPNLPGATYTQEGFDTDSESDCSEPTKRTCSDKTKQFSSPKRDPLELQDLEASDIQTKHQ